MKKWFILTTLVVSIGIAIIDFSGMLQSSRQSFRSDYFKKGAAVSSWPSRSKSGTPFASSLDNRATRSPVSKQIGGLENDDSLLTANEYIELNRKALGIQKHHDLKPLIYSNPLGTNVKYTVFQDNIPVVGMGLLVRVGRDNSVLGIEHDYRPLEKADTAPSQKLSPDEIISQANNRYALADKDLNSIPIILYAAPNSTKPQLAYVMRVVDQNASKPRVLQIVFRVEDGQILARSQARAEF